MGSGAGKLGKILGKDRVGDYKAVQSQLDAIRSNLRTTGAGIGGALTASQARTLGSIQRVADKGVAKSTGAYASATQQIRNRYGTGMSGVTAPLLAPAAASAKATGLGATAAVKGASKMAKGGQLALGIEQAGAKTAMAGAEYALNTALAYRAKQDAQLVYEQKSQWQLWKKQQDYLATQEAAAAESAGASGMQTVVNQAPQFATALTKYMESHPGKTPAEAVGEVQAQTGIGAEDAQATKYFLSMANYMKTGSTPEEAAQQAASDSFSALPGFSSLHLDVISSGVTATLSQSAAVDLSTAMQADPSNPTDLPTDLWRQIQEKPGAAQAVLGQAGYAAAYSQMHIVTQAAYDTMTAQGYTYDQIRAAAAVNGYRLSGDIPAVPVAGAVGTPAPSGNVRQITSG